MAMLLLLTIKSLSLLTSCGVDLKEKSKSLYDDMKQIMKETEVAQDYVFTADTTSGFSISNNFQDSKAMYVIPYKKNTLSWLKNVRI